MRMGKSIRTLRIANGFSQDKLSDVAGLDRSYLSMIESERRVPSLAVVKKIAQALGAPLDLLRLMAADRKELQGLKEREVKAIGLMLLRILRRTLPPTRSKR